MLDYIFIIADKEGGCLPGPGCGLPPAHRLGILPLHRVVRGTCRMDLAAVTRNRGEAQPVRHNT